MLSKYAAPVAALVASAAAQSSCTFSATTVTAAADATAIAGCTAISGNIAFASGAANLGLSLDQVESITGDLTYAQDDNVQTFSAPKLTEVTGAIMFNNLTKLNSISMEALQKTGDVTIISCASLGTVTTGTQYQEAGKISIQNTQLSSLGGFGNLSKIDSLEVSGNTLIADITMNIGTVGDINIGSNQENNQGLSVAFNNLTKADMIIVNNATTVSFNALQESTGNMAFFYNNFETFVLPNLTTAGGLNIQSNNKLTNLSLPMLQNLTSGTSGGSFSVVNNTALKTLGGFDQLSVVDGAVTFAGVFSNITSLSNFKKVNGTFRVSSTQDIQNSVCNQVQQLRSNGVIRGSESCTGQSKSAASSVSGTTSDSSSSSSAAAGILDIPALPALSAGFGAFLLQFLLSF